MVMVVVMVMVVMVVVMVMVVMVGVMVMVMMSTHQEAIFDNLDLCVSRRVSPPEGNLSGVPISSFRSFIHVCCTINRI